MLYIVFLLKVLSLLQHSQWFSMSFVCSVSSGYVFVVFVIPECSQHDVLKATNALTCSTCHSSHVFSQYYPYYSCLFSKITILVILNTFLLSQYFPKCNMFSISSHVTYFSWFYTLSIVSRCSMLVWCSRCSTYRNILHVLYRSK